MKTECAIVSKRMSPKIRIGDTNKSKKYKEENTFFSFLFLLIVSHQASRTQEFRKCYRIREKKTTIKETGQ